jgi:DHA1 family bicyclomycin/chloramphenicol resistance-like MFS transporter
MTLFSNAFRHSSTLIMWVLVVVVTTGAIETDIFVPSFPAIKDYFNTTESMVQMIVGINFLGLCISSLAYGPLSDAYGRRNTLLVGNILFLLASIGCITAESIETLLMWRFIQGLGTSVVFIVPGAIIYDIYSREDAAKALGWFGALITFTMACAPMLGAYVSETWGWQANFIVIASLSVISFLLILGLINETLPVEKRMPLHSKAIAINYFKVLTSRKSFWYMIIICCLFAGELIYITNLSLIFIDNLHMDEHVYSYYQGAILLTFAIFSYFSGRFIYRFGMLFMRNVGFGLSALGGFSLLAVALIAPEDPLLITISMCIYSLGFALCCGILFGDFMHLFPDIKGLAAALASFVRLLFISVMIAVAGILYDGTIVPVAWMIAVFCALLLVGWVSLPKPSTETVDGENLMH